MGNKRGAKCPETADIKLSRLYQHATLNVVSLRKHIELEQIFPPNCMHTFTLKCTARCKPFSVKVCISF